MDDLGTRLLVKVAQLYHIQGLNQDQIGRQLGVSRSKVSRMLKEARERALVEVTIHYPSQAALDIERRLEAEFGLREALVVDAGGALGGRSIAPVAAAAADYLQRILQPGDVLGVSGGEAAMLMAQALPATSIEGVSVLQLGTAAALLGERVAFPSAEVALRIAQKLGCLDRLTLIPLPSLLDDETIRDALLRDTGVRRVIALLGSCTVALVGVGALDTISLRAEDGDAAGAAAAPQPSAGDPPRRRVSKAFTEAEVTELRRVGAVGEICTRFFDIHGAPSETALDRRMVALDLRQLRAIPLVIGIACGIQKAPAILGALRGGLLKALVTDDTTAIEVLALARSVGGDTPVKGGQRGEHEGSRSARAAS